MLSFQSDLKLLPVHFSVFFPEEAVAMRIIYGMFHGEHCCIIQQLFACVCPYSWTTSGLKSQGRLSVGSNRDREISMSVGLGRSKLDSKGGVVGGNIDVNTLEMVCK